MNFLRLLLASLVPLSLHCSVAADPPPYVLATAHYILPETTSEESGYFSLSESLDGKIQVGTAKYNHNSFLVEFDPRTGQQRIVLDTHKLCGLSASGYAAQSKIHTRNFVGPDGKVYVGSKQGYAVKGDTQSYPGGYVMTYDPRTGRAENLGMPFAGQGVIDVVADEARKRLYVVTCEDQHWMLGTLAGAPWRELGPMLTPYAATLVDSRGVASAITRDFELAQFDPANDRVTNRPIQVDGQPWKRANNSAIPIWQLDPDGRHAWLILMNDPTLLRIDLHSAGEQITSENRGLMLAGKSPDSRGALTIHPDGRIYALVRVDNTTGFGAGYLHHLVRYDPAAKRHEDLGVLKVQNPDYFDWSPGADGKPKPHTHGFHRLPDDTLTPLHAHMALIAAHDGTLYATIIYPFTLLKIDAYKIPARAASAAAVNLDATPGKQHPAGPTEAEGRPLIRKLGTIDLDLVETTPIVFDGKLWRFEWIRHGTGQHYWDNRRGMNYFRFRDPATGEVTPPFADEHEFGSAFVEGNTVYVTGTQARGAVNVFASRDLRSWETWTAIPTGRYGIFNTSICKAGAEFVLAFEIDRPVEEAGQPFTIRFVKSPDLHTWTLTPPDCNFTKERYSAAPCLRWLDGWFYLFYLEAHAGYETRVVRSRDLVQWQPSPFNPVLRASPADQQIANASLTDEQRHKISSAKNLNNSDLDFCEWQGGLVLNYSWGNQQGTEFLASATYDGTFKQFLRGWFPEK